MDIMRLTNVSNDTIARKATHDLGQVVNGSSFDTLFKNVLGQVDEANQLQMDASTAELEFSMGEATNTHDLLIAQQKALISLQYTTAVKNNIMDAYNNIMQMQI